MWVGIETAADGARVSRSSRLRRRPELMGTLATSRGPDFSSGPGLDHQGRPARQHGRNPDLGRVPPLRTRRYSPETRSRTINGVSRPNAIKTRPAPHFRWTNSREAGLPASSVVVIDQRSDGPICSPRSARIVFIFSSTVRSTRPIRMAISAVGNPSTVHRKIVRTPSGRTARRWANSSMARTSASRTQVPTPVGEVKPPGRVRVGKGSVRGGRHAVPPDSARSSWRSCTS